MFITVDLSCGCWLLCVNYVSFVASSNYHFFYSLQGAGYSLRSKLSLIIQNFHTSLWCLYLIPQQLEKNAYCLYGCVLLNSQNFFPCLIGIAPSVIGAFGGLSALMGVGATFISANLVRKLGILKVRLYRTIAIKFLISSCQNP